MPAEPLCALTLEGRAEPGCLDRVHDLVEQLWQRVPGVQPSDRYRFETAVIEVAGNIVEHGGPGVRLRLWLLVHPDRVEAHFCDTGCAVEPQATAGRLPEPLAEAGRGIALARAAVDELAYVRTGTTNRWYVLKQRAPTD